MRLSVFALSSACAALAICAPVAAEPAKKAKTSAAGALASRSEEPAPRFGPAPAWIKEEKPGALDPKRKEDPFVFLLSGSQELLTPEGLENYVEYVVQPLNLAGLQAIGNVSIPWNVDRTELVLNKVTIERGDQKIDALKREDVSVLRRETKLEQSTLTGIRTVVMPVRGLQLGDKLHVGFTFKTKRSAIGKTEEVQDVAIPLPVARLVRRFVVSKDLPVRWAGLPEAKDGAAPGPDGHVERVYTAANVEPDKRRSFLPGRFQHRLIQVTAFHDWAELADLLAPSFELARKTADGSDVAKLADKIAATAKDPGQRLLAALRIAQEDVRYVALLLGDGDYKPMNADDVWAQRYGDCKGKTAFLLALLDRLGIRAEPVLASTEFDDGLDRRLPSLAMFDHVYVRAHVGGTDYYLDGTDFGQRTLEELRTGTTVHVLPLTKGSKLEAIPDVMPSAPLVQTDLIWDARSGVLDKVPFEATLTLRGMAAAVMRGEAANSSDREKLIESYKNKVAGVANDDLQYVSTEAEAADGSYVVRFKGSVALDWSPVDGLKGNRLELSQSTLKWEPDFDRDDDGAKDIPVAMAFPFWERTVEKVMLPNGGKDFTLDARNVNETAAATQFSRTLTMDSGVVTAVSDFKRLSRELDASSARSAKSALDRIRTDYAYVVSKKKLKLQN